jgi:glycogen(starch) synthase
MRALPEIEITLAVMGPAPPHPLPNMIHAPFRLEWMDEPWEDLEQAGRWLLSLEADLRPDVVHLNGYVHAALPWRAPLLVVAHSCVLSWWEAVKAEAAPASWNRYRDAVAAGIADADIVVAPTQAMLDATRRHYGRSRETRVIPNGIDLSGMRETPKEPFVFAAGRVWDEAKNLRALDCPLGWPVFIAGDAEGTGFTHAVGLGRLAPEDVARYMARAAIYAFPARYEPFGLSVLEAAAAGCALVLGDIPSLRENWEGAALFGIEHLTYLIADPGLRQDYGRRAQARARKFPIERSAQAYLELYRSLAGQSPDRRAA